jgi:hypothetical protein
MKSGNRNHVMPGARIRWMVTMKLSPVRMDEKPVMNTPTPVINTCDSEPCELYGV